MIDIPGAFLFKILYDGILTHFIVPWVCLRPKRRLKAFQIAFEQKGAYLSVRKPQKCFRKHEKSHFFIKRWYWMDSALIIRRLFSFRMLFDHLWTLKHANITINQKQTIYEVQECSEALGAFLNLLYDVAVFRKIDKIQEMCIKFWKLRLSCKSLAPFSPDEFFAPPRRLLSPLWCFVIKKGA